MYTHLSQPNNLINLNFDQSKILNPLQRKIYDLIFKRTVASQMSSYEYEETKCTFQIQKCKKYNFISKNNKCLFDGFRKVYHKFIDPNKKEDDDLDNENSSEELNEVEMRERMSKLLGNQSEATRQRLFILARAGDESATKLLEFTNNFERAQKSISLFGTQSSSSEPEKKCPV